MRSIKVNAVAACAALLGALVVAAPGVLAAPIVQDGFNDGARSNGADPLDADWYRVKYDPTLSGTDSLLASVTADNGTPGIGSGNALKIENTTTTGDRHLVANFPACTLLVPGDYVDLTFDFRVLGGPPSTDRGFRFGLFNSNGSVIGADEKTSSATENDIGYFARISTGANTSATLNKDKGVASFMGGTDLGIILTNSTFGGINDNNRHSAHVTLTLAQFESSTTPGSFYNGLKIAFVLDEGTAGAKSMLEDDKALETGTTTFNEIGFSSYTGGLDLVIDNINIQGVPEPATLCLLALGGAAVLARRRP
jgi:hypothetical protein